MSAHTITVFTRGTYHNPDGLEKFPEVKEDEILAKVLRAADHPRVKGAKQMFVYRKSTQSMDELQMNVSLAGQSIRDGDVLEVSSNPHWCAVLFTIVDTEEQNNEFHMHALTSISVLLNSKNDVVSADGERGKQLSFFQSFQKLIDGLIGTKVNNGNPWPSEFGYELRGIWETFCRLGAMNVNGDDQVWDLATALTEYISRSGRKSSSWKSKAKTGKKKKKAPVKCDEIGGPAAEAAVFCKDCKHFFLRDLQQCSTYRKGLSIALAVACC